MRPDTIADVLGVVMLATVAALPLSCTPTLPISVQEDLQPLVAATGAYGVASAAAPKPSPAPSTACDPGCKCGGTGVERSGDGLALVGCRCAETCPCKAKKAASTAGRPGWSPRNTDH